MKERILYKLNSIIITLIFCLAIFVPFSIGIIEQDKYVSEIEKRKLSKFPDLPENVKTIKAFPKLFDTYYSDHFGLRDWFTKYYKLLKFNLGDSSSNDVTRGKNGWLFLGSIKEGYTNFDDPIGDARNVNLYTLGELKQLAAHMKAVKNFLNKKGIEYLFLIAPHKHSIYFDQLPDYIEKVNSHSAADQLIRYLKEHTDVIVIDLRDSLIKEKNKHQLYNKTGTHWNQYAANVVQYEILSTIKKMFPTKIFPKLYDSSIFESHIATDRDLEGMLGIKFDPPPYEPYIVFEPGAKPVSFYPLDSKGKLFGQATHTNVNLTQQLNAVIFRDSYFVMLEPYFYKHFKRSTFIWKKSNYQLLTEYLKKEKPDIIIEEWVERNLPYVPSDSKRYFSSNNKVLFNKSNEIIFSKENIKQLRFSKNLKLINKKNNHLKLISTQNDPMVLFPELSFESKKQYMLNIQITSSVQSQLQVFFTDSTNDLIFSEKNSLSAAIKKGDNDIYIALKHPSLGNALRLDPIIAKGEIIIKSLIIKRVEFGF